MRFLKFHFYQTNVFAPTHFLFRLHSTRLKMELRGKDSDVGQLRDKVKRLVKSRSAQDLDEEPVRLDPRASKSEGEGRLVVEDVIEPVAAGSQEGSR